MSRKPPESTLLRLVYDDQCDSRPPSRSVGTCATQQPRSTVPDYALWRVVDLKAECRRLGLVTSRSKQELIELLRQQHEPRVDGMRTANNAIATESAVITSGGESDADDSDASVTYVGTSLPASAATSKSRARGRKSIEALDDSFTQLSLTPSAERADVSPRRRKAAEKSAVRPPSDDSASPKRTRRKSTASPESDEPARNVTVAELWSAEANPLDAPLCAAIEADADLHRRILLMEPVSLEEMLSVAAKANCLSGFSTRDRPQISTWLDTQGICYTETDSAD